MIGEETLRAVLRSGSGGGKRTKLEFGNRVGIYRRKRNYDIASKWSDSDDISLSDRQILSRGGDWR